MNGLSEARAFGGCFVLGFQNLEQIHHLYGNHVARTMSSLLGTKLVFRVDDPYSTEHLSKVFGMQEILVPTKSISFGAHQVRDGVSLHHRDKLRPVIKPSDIAQLPNLSAYLKFPTDLPPTKLQFKYVSRSPITEPCTVKNVIREPQIAMAEQAIDTSAFVSQSVNPSCGVDPARSIQAVNPESMETQPANPLEIEKNKNNPVLRSDIQEIDKKDVL
jgi:type IV secretory pathway TraG/TraD family ATPase VirD4